MELLQQIRVPFKAISVDIDETRLGHESPVSFVERMALEKARAGWERSAGLQPVLGSDTIVVIDGEVLGKPADKVEAHNMLRMLSDKCHQVITAVALVQGERSMIRVSVSEVCFDSLSDEIIQRYWQTGEPADKAGAYAVQGMAAAFIKTLNGSYSGVMGLPLHETCELLGEFGLDVTLSWVNQQADKIE
jgi:septum formation protein